MLFFPTHLSNWFQSIVASLILNKTEKLVDTISVHPITVITLEDHYLTREGIRSLLASFHCEIARLRASM